MKCPRVGEKNYADKMRKYQAEQIRNVRKKNAGFQRQEHANHIAQKLPLLEFCELCPDEHVRHAIQRHHPDYDYPEIFVSLCRECHDVIDSFL